MAEYKCTGGGINGRMDTATFELFRSACSKLHLEFFGAGHLSVSGPIGVQLMVFFCSSDLLVLLTPQGSPGLPRRCNCRVLILAVSQSFHLFKLLTITTR